MKVSIMDFPLPCLMTKLVNHLQDWWTGGLKSGYCWDDIWIPHSDSTTRKRDFNDGRKPPMHWFQPTCGCQSNMENLDVNKAW
jgi:hypothetical protein